MRTPLCDLLGIEQPVILAPFGPWEQVDLAAAVSNAGGLGSLGTALRSPQELRDQWTRLRALTDRPFAINHTGRPLNLEAFDATLQFRPVAISFHMGVPAELVARAHDRGIVWVQTVGDPSSAEAALGAGADVLIAQGLEAGGNAGWIATLVLVPLVVDLAGSVPVVAAGGIGDGRGIAAALALGAQGVSLGTRFLATDEMTVAPEWKARIVDAGALDAVKVPHAERVMPPFTIPQVGPAFAPRALRTPLIEQLETAPETVEPQEAAREVVTAVCDGRGHEFLPFTGQSAGLVHEVLPAEQLMERLVADAVEALSQATATLGRGTVGADM